MGAETRTDLILKNSQLDTLTESRNSVACRYIIPFLFVSEPKVSFMRNQFGVIDFPNGNSVGLPAPRQLVAAQLN